MEFHERTVVQKAEGNRLKDYTEYRIQPDVYAVMKPSYDTFHAIIH